MVKKPNATLIERFFKGECTPVEAYGGRFTQVSLLSGKVKFASLTDSFEEYLVVGELLALRGGSVEKSYLI